MQIGVTGILLYQQNSENGFLYFGKWIMWKGVCVQINAKANADANKWCARKILLINSNLKSKNATIYLHSRCAFAYLLLIETFVYLAAQLWFCRYCEAVGGERSDSVQFDKCFALGKTPGIIGK